MKLTLRPYQQEAVAAMILDKNNQNKSIVSLPTGSGKSLVIADFVEKTNEPTIVLQPSREILSQNREKLLTYVDKKDVGIYSASFKSKQVKKYTFATIQSIYKYPQLFREFSTIIIDEAHGYKQDGMFEKFVKAVRGAKVYGMTATPYRNETETEYNYRDREVVVETFFKMLTQVGFNDIIYVKNTKELQDDGYLCPLEYQSATDMMADFNARSEKKLVESFELQLSFSGFFKLQPVLSKLSDFSSSIVFCPSLRIAQMLSEKVWWVETAYISGKTKAKERKQILEDFKSGKIQAVFNVGVLTTGFDHPGLDCIILARPTKSLNLYNQMLGRGTRNAPGKTHCTVIDVTGTVRQLGKLEDIQIKKDLSGSWNVETPKGFMRNKRVTYFQGEY